MSLKFIVTGTGRCGTVFFAKMLSSLGLPCGHESVFDYSADSVIIDRVSSLKNLSISDCSQFNNFIDKKKEVDWIDISEIVGDSSYLAAPYLSHPLVHQVPVIHIFRNPLEVISSYVLDFNYFRNKTPDDKNIYNKKGWENRIYENIPELSLMDSQIERACWFYIRWNQIISDSCKFRKYLLVDVKNINYDILSEFLNIKIDNQSIYCKNDSNSNKKRKRNLTMGEIPIDMKKILSREIEKLMQKPSLKIYN
jgi:hypothetical protein